MSYYSARIAVMCLVPGPVPEEGYTVDVQVHVYRASDFDEAKRIALEIGRSEEHSYENQFGERVTWKFIRIENITRLGDDLDRVEVSSRMEAWVPPEPFNSTPSEDDICENIEYFDE